MKEIYGVANSGWNAPQFNWGSAMGTGHDCAAICREMYATSLARQRLVEDLVVEGSGPKNFEEVKLVLALAWQKGRSRGTVGGRDGYGVVLTNMAAAQRYEEGEDDECSRFLVQDMEERFSLLKPTNEELELMATCITELETNNIDFARRRCAGLVLKAMGFIQDGL